MSEITPIIQSVDSYETNHKLGIAFEAKVGKGKLFVLCVDPDKDKNTRLATEQLFFLVKKYMNSESFNPQAILQPYEVDAIFATETEAADDQSSNPAIQQLLNK